MNPNKFFSELKRRNVYKVALTYAIVAWLLAQMAGLAADSFNAPEWVIKMIIVVLFLGFPVAIILAWAFEMSPQGIIRTASKKAQENPYSEHQKKPLTGKLFIGVLIVIIIGQFAYNKYVNGNSVDTSEIEKSIAVLPFINDSADENNLYFCNGIMEGILDHLSKIEDLTVISRTSVEQFRHNKPTSKEIAEKLGVQYLVEGSVQKLGNKVVIFAQLIYARDDKHLWSQKYSKDITELFTVQANVTKAIAEKLQALILPEVKERIEAVPTHDLEAYEYYLKGNNYRMLASSVSQEKKDWVSFLNKAKLLYELSIEQDSLLAPAYIGLAHIEFDRNRYSNIDEDDYLDQVISLINKALEIDPNLSEAYTARGLYYSQTNNTKSVKRDYQKALELNPNDIDALYLRAYINRLYDLDFIEAVKDLKKIEKRVYSESELRRLNIQYVQLYAHIGDLETLEFYLNKIPFQLVSDPLWWWYYQYTKRFDDAISIANKYPVNNQIKNSALGESYFYKGELDKALEYFEMWNDQVSKEDFMNMLSVRVSHRFGELLVLTGQKERGMEMINRQLNLNKRLIELGREDLGLVYDLAGIYSFKGEKEKAFIWMKRFEKEHGWLRYSGLNLLVRFDPQFDNLRDEQQFNDWVHRGEIQLETEKRKVRDYLASEEEKK